MVDGLENIPDKIYFKIGEVSELTGVKPYVLRYWETEFNVIKPVKSAANQRMYKRRQVELFFEIKRLLYEEKFTIAGAKKVMHEKSRGHGENPSGSDRSHESSRRELERFKKALLEIKKLVELQ